MSITLGIYDLFAYLIPGLLYLYVFNEFSKLTGFSGFDLFQLGTGQTINALNALILLFAAFIIGYLIEPVAQVILSDWIYRKKVSVESLDGLKQQHPLLDIRFEPKDCDLLLTFLRQRNKEITQAIDKFQADSMMLRNISFGLSLFTLLHLIHFLLDRSPGNVFAAIAAALLAVIAYRGSFKFRRWYFNAIFEAALQYGADIYEVLGRSKKKAGVKSGKTRKKA